MNRYKLSEPGDYYEEVDGEILPPLSEPEPFKLGPKEKGEIIARAYIEKNDELTRQVIPSTDMDRAYQISRKLLELNDHDFDAEKPLPMPVKQEVIDGVTLGRGQTSQKKWFTDKITKERRSYSVTVAYVIRTRAGKKIYLESNKKIPEDGGSRFVQSEWDNLERKIDGGEGREIN